MGIWVMECDYDLLIWMNYTQDFLLLKSALLN